MSSIEKILRQQADLEDRDSRYTAFVAYWPNGEKIKPRIEQLVENLLINALKYGMKTPFTVKAVRKDDRIVLERPS